MKVILSIKPEFVEKIISGEKKFEFRRKIFKRDVVSVIVYASAPIKAVVGEFTIDYIINYNLNLLWKLTQREAGISEDFFYKYFKNIEKGYAIKIKEFKKYNEPQDIKDYGLKYPPQSYVYTMPLPVQQRSSKVAAYRKDNKDNYGSWPFAYPLD